MWEIERKWVRQTKNERNREKVREIKRKLGIERETERNR